MLKSFFDFIRTESRYVILILALSVAYLVAFSVAPKKSVQIKDSVSLQNFEKAEKDFQTKLKDPQSLRDFQKNEPGKALIVQLLTALILCLLGIGLVLICLYAIAPDFRKALRIEIPPSAAQWRLLLLLKSVVLILTFSFTCGVFLSIIKRVWLGQMSDNFFILTHTLIADMACVIAVLYLTRMSGGNEGDVGLRRPAGGWGKETLISWGAYASLLPFFGAALVLVVWISHVIGYKPDPHPLVNVFLEEERKPWMIAYSFALAAVVGPMVEELFFRGFCYRIFREKIGVTAALVISSFLFSLIHGNPFAFLPIFVLGYGLGFIYELRQSLFAPIVLHITHNVLFISYFFLMKSVIS